MEEEYRSMIKQNNDLVSVIVPVYNIGAIMLNRCIESIISQTYCNLEIILIDDGSTDDSGKICDVWQARDERIKVIHRTNGGLSAARNTGTKNANGKYIVFVDSDDWIEDEMIELLYQAIIKTQSDLAICGIMSTNGSKKVELPWYQVSCVLNKEDAYKELIENERITSHAWNKMFKFEIIHQVPFPEGKLYEDIRMMHKVFRMCDQIAIVEEYLYNYYRRTNSIASSSNLYNKLEFVAAFQERYEYVKKITPQYAEKVLSQIASSISLSLVQNKFSKNDKKKHVKDLKEMQVFLRRKDVYDAVRKFCTRNVRVYYYLAMVCPRECNTIYRFFLRKFTKGYKEWIRF